MTLLAERQSAPIETKQGVIEEARRRRRKRLLRPSIAAVGLLAIAVFVLVANSDGGAAKLGPLHLPPEAATIQPAKLAAEAPDGIAVRVLPELQGAEAGWTVQIIQRSGLSGTDGRLPSPENAIVSASSGWSSGERHDTTVVVTGPDAARVGFSDGRTVRTITEPGLPFGMRVALLLTPHHPITTLRSNFFDALRVTSVWNAKGQLLHSAPGVGSGLTWRIWNPPAKPSPGACTLTASGGYQSKWGQVAAKLRPYPTPIYGRAFLSCIDTEYFPAGCHGGECGLRASILLDAAKPNTATPAPIPGLTAIPGLPGITNTAANYGFEQLSARKIGNAWLVVTGGGLHAEHARIELLRHLTPTVHA